MRKSLAMLGTALVAVVLATSAFAENRGTTFTPIGFIDPPGNFPYSAVTAMNPEGTIFMANPSYFGNYCVEWTKANGWGTQIGASTSVCKLASDGTVMATGAYPPENPLGFIGTPPSAWPGVWTGVLDEWTLLPPNADYPMGCTGSSRMSFYDMATNNGGFATGLTYVQTTTPTNCATFNAFRWDKATNTTVALGSPSGKGSRGNDITNDGNSVVGWGRGVNFDRRGARWDNGTWSWLGDPNGEEPKMCAGSGLPCSSNSSSATSGCPGEYVDDGFCTNRGTCQNRGVCTANVCVGGTNPGVSCTSNTQCRGACAGGTNDGTTCNSDSTCAGTCVGPNAGAVCTSNGTCPDTVVCVANPDWNDSLFKGEAYAVTPDGAHACGRNSGYDYPDGWNSGYISNPDGSFTKIPPPESFPDFVDPFAISADGKTVVGRVGNPFFGSIPFFWNEGMGTQDVQLFLLAQGLDELFFWQVADLYDVSANGKVMGGRAIDPDGLVEGFIIDISKVWICHTPPGQPENARTLGINSDNVASHIAHGDFLGTCEFLSSGGLARAAALREQLNEKNMSTANPYEFGNKLSTWNGPATAVPPRIVKGGAGARPKLPLEK
jgi:hypothetical protein